MFCFASQDPGDQAAAAGLNSVTHTEQCLNSCDFCCNFLRLMTSQKLGAMLGVDFSRQTCV